MSQIKYQIFVFLVLITLPLFSQNNDEDKAILVQNRIDFIIEEADKETLLSNYYRAIDILEQGLEIAKTNNDSLQQGILLSKIANLQYNLNESQDAMSTIIKAMHIQRSIEDKSNLAVSRYTCGIIHLGDKDYINALDYFKSAKAIFEEEGLNELVTKVTLDEAKAYIGQNNIAKANTLVDKAIILSKKHEMNSLLSASLIKSGELAILEEKYDKALSQTLEGSNLANTHGNLEILNESYRVLSEVYEKSGNYELANTNLKLFIELNDSISSAKEATLLADKQLIDQNKDILIQSQKEQIDERNESESLNKLTTILSVGLITILSLLTLSLYKNNNIRLKTNNMLYKKNEELLTEKERAEIAAKTKTNFLSTVTHELRTPLYAVTGLTNMLLEENPKPEQIQHLKSLKFSGEYLLTFINDILQINKIEANKVDIEPENFNLKKKITNVIAALNNSALDNNIQMHFEYESGLPETFNADQLKISQILINLIGNSIKFTKDGDIWVRVFKLQQEGDNYILRFEIEDNGIGISKEKQEMLFESFAQGSIQINRKYGGTGLGLSIVKGLIEILKGKIYLDSELGKGSKFTFEVPLKYAEAVAKPQKIEYFDKIDELELSNIKILVVEDNKINQMITKKILNKMKLNCEIVDNGESAVNKAKETTYDVILMDIHMPGISGLEATKLIRGFDKNITIFALTAVTLEDKMHEFEEAGFTDIISKPFKQEDFEKKLYEALIGGTPESA